MEQLIINEQTEETLPCAEAQKEEGERTEAVSLKKFKDEKSLQKAYESLEAEFTKRCQRLKILEEENRALRSAAETKQGSFAEDIDEPWTEEKEIEEFFGTYPEALDIAKELAAAAVGGEDYGKKGFMERAYIGYLKDIYDKLRSESATEEYLLSHIEGTSIKDGIIREFLSGVNNSNSVKPLIGAAGEIALAPVKKPKTLQEAAILAKDMLKIV